MTSSAPKVPNSQQGNPAAAIARYRMALEVDQNEPGPLNNLSWLLATTSDAALRNPAEAVKAAERACEITKYRRPLLVGTLAAAYAAAGRFAEAVKTGQKAKKLAMNSGENDLAQRNQQLLEMYQHGQSYVEPSQAVIQPVKAQP
jgi:spermidine synthase